MKYTGGPAFPSTHPHGREEGMYLRDWFAGMAMQGIVASDTERSPEQVPIIVKSAYVMADAMLKERRQA
jgi:hypothetical protein